MTPKSPLSAGWPRRLLGILLALVLGMLAVAWLSAELSAQNAGQKPPEEEEKEPPKPKKVVVEEEEGGGRPRSKKVIPVDDGKPAKPPVKPVLPEEPPSDLAVAAKETKHPELKTFYEDLATPHDRLTTATRAIRYNIEPLTQYFPDELPKFRGGLVRVRAFDQDWKPLKESFTLGNEQVRRIVPYEEIVQEEVARFLEKTLDRLPPASKAYLSRKDMLRAAELALGSAEAFHVSSRERGLRKRDEWVPVGEKLHRRLFDLRLEQLAQVVAENDWDGAADHARKLAKAYPDPAEQEPIARVLVDGIKKGLQGEYSDEKFKEARRRLRLMEDYFPGSKSAEDVATSLRRQAEALFRQAQEWQKKNDPQKALQLMALAEEIWPRVAGLGDEVLKLKNTYPILRVGVRELPVDLLPGKAATDVERQAVELIFESLVRLRTQRGLGTHYEPVLAAGLPRLVSLGREFRLARNAYWSDGRPVSAADVAETVRLLNDPAWAGANPALGKLLMENPEVGGDAFRLSLNLKQGYLDPLSLMTFKVLPRDVQPQVLQYNSRPVGSGPYQYLGVQTTERGRKFALFQTNANYASRDGKRNLPRIREIHFILHDSDDDLAQALAKGEIDFWPLVPAAKVKPMRAAPQVLATEPMPNRRIWFLAINHRRLPFQNNPELRRALALAINRDDLLDRFFRGGLERPPCRALNGPYPPGSWACDPNVRTPLYSPDQAKVFLARAVEKTSGPVRRLSLKFPAGDPGVEKAMAALAEQVKSVLSLELDLERTEPHKLREEVEKSHTYDLAYYHYDYASDAYWLWPLFDLNGVEGGTNYLGYIDGALAGLLGQAMRYRDFSRVRETTHFIHRMLDQQMPLIPLWQIDTFAAYRTPDVQPTTIDPLVIFADVEHWTKVVGR